MLIHICIFLCRVIDAHPCLGQAAMLVAASVTEDATKGGASRATSRRKCTHLYCRSLQMQY